jgi:outer membrane protein
MKKLSLLIIVSVFFGLAGQTINAQDLKFGHIDSQELIIALPEYETAIARIQRFGTELENGLELLQVEFNNRYVAYERDANTLTDIVRDARAQELSDMTRRLQEAQQVAQEQFQARQAELFQPIVEKVNRAIQDVGRENGFIYIFMVGEQSGTNLLYFDEAKSTNILQLAKAKLGIR